MEKCPTCSAKYSGKEFCHRCKTDLKLLIEIENNARKHLKNAFLNYESKDYEAMFFNAMRANDLICDKNSIKLLSLSAFFTKRYKLAVCLHRLLNS